MPFVDPSCSLIKDGPFKKVGRAATWSEPRKVHDHLSQFQVEDLAISYKLASGRFSDSYSPLRLPEMDVAFIDGNHSYKHVKIDFLHSVEHVRNNSFIFLRDTNIYCAYCKTKSGGT